MSSTRLRPRNSARVTSVIAHPDRVCRGCGDHLARVHVRLVIEGEVFRTSMCLQCATQEVEHKLDLFRDHLGRVIVRTYGEDRLEHEPEIPLEYVDPDMLDRLADDDQRFVVC